MVTNNIVLFGNTYCILYDPNHFLVKSLGVTYYPLETTKHNHQNKIVFLDSFVDSIMFYSTIEFLQFLQPAF
jgi:hypothetical protein